MKSPDTLSSVRSVFSQVFLTGATGILGGNLLKQLLIKTQCTVHCLVRASSKEEGQARLWQLLETYDPQKKLFDEFCRRVRVVVGEVNAPRFNLSEKDYQELGNQIDLTLHSAALTNLFLRFSTIAPINIGGTQNILDFVKKTSSTRLVYVSTYTVMGDKTFDASVVFTERDYDIGQGFQFMTYQRSKFMAEGLVRQSDVHWTIVRPGQIFGESDTGYYPQGQGNISGLFYDIFKTVIETGVAFDSKTPFDVVPVDYVSRAILGLCESEHVGETFHLTNPDFKTYSQVIDLVRRCGYRIRGVSQEEYKRLLTERSLATAGAEYKSPTVSAFRWWFKRKQFNFEEGAQTSCEMTRRILEAKSIKCPAVDTKLIGLYLEVGRRENYFPSVPQTESHVNINEEFQSAV